MNRLILFAIIFFSIFSPSAFAGTIQLPKTGQTTMYEMGDDGDLEIGVAWPDPRFTNPDNSTPISGDVVVDQLTGLMWARNANLMPSRDLGWDNDSTPNDGGVFWQHALDYVAKLNSENYLGCTDWRLPNINELESLVHAGMPNSATWLIGQGFTNVQSNGYWSSTTVAVDTDWAWDVYINSGGVGYGYKSNQYNYGYYVWPVRAGQCGSFDDSAICLPKTGQTTSYYSGDDGDLQMGIAWPAPRFVDNADGTVVDKLTGLMWTRSINLPHGDKTWQEALAYVAAMNSGSGTYGYTDWRLPNRKELIGLIDHSQSFPALPQGHPFIDVVIYNYEYWSSTTVANYSIDAWTPILEFGYVGHDRKSLIKHLVWPVRAGQCGSLGDSDGDTVCDDVDNCPEGYNPGQQDCDEDGTADACDPDTIDPDGDGVDQACDNCWTISNPTQQDTNSNCPVPPYTSDPQCGDACNVCMADYDNNGKMNLTDLGILKSEFGRTNCKTVSPACRADANGDGKVNLTDLGKLKSEFGKTNCFQ